MNTNRRKAFRTITDVLHSPIAELAALRRKPAQKTDRVMRASKLEDNIYAELREDDTEMDMTENAAAQRLKSFPALSRDAFADACRPGNPRPVTEAEIADLYRSLL